MITKKRSFFLALLMLQTKNFVLAASPKTDEKKTQEKIILPRHLFFPKIFYKNKIEDKNEIEYPLQNGKYKYIFIFASWSEKAKNVAKIFQIFEKQLKDRQVDIIVLCSSDTTESLEDWKKEFKPKFNIFFASMRFIDSLENPKIPSIWLLGPKGEVLHSEEIPNEDSVLKSIAKTKIMTDFRI